MSLLSKYAQRPTQQVRAITAVLPLYDSERFDAEEWLSRVTSILDMVYAGCTEGLCSSEQEEDEHLTNQEIKKVIQLVSHG